MTHYLFQFGRDITIAKLELLSVFKRDEVNYHVVIDADEYIVLELDEGDLEHVWANIAGSIKVAKVFSRQELVNADFLDTIDFYFPKNYNLFLTLLGDQSNTLDFESAIHKYCKTHKLRGTIKRLDSHDPLKARTSYEKDSESSCEVIIVRDKKEWVISQVVEYADPKEYYYLDTKRPVQRFSHGTSFRLATMMVNILGLEKGKTFVDPFCGIGTFLMIGMLQGYNSVGIDIDGSVFEGARQNIAWLKEQIGSDLSVRIIHGDSAKEEFSADACVFEPYMGPFLKELPTERDARKEMQKLYNLYLDIFKNVYKHMAPHARIVCILPEFQTQEGTVVPLPKDIFKQRNFQLVDLGKEFPNVSLTNPIEYTTPDGSRILRKLWIAEKG
ncbi:hypothetical protein KC717_05140 [Candidatus Dojkabacteria bacterium]|uniref:Ribosomal RNA large subunit methyltransferase K/L-like methyltransferase domain-containing protein n=1 Tax=Candidatus Dojkabacteria bacterium TaxID=2099670 RepID=A0A955RKL5_9BACT|nr:hypothetical protein [Candidatus Dojkabacteria bacterium]